MIELEHLVVEYGQGERATRAVDDVSFSVEPGASLALVGPSGCGKTSLLFAVAGLIRPTSGEILLDGTRIEGAQASMALILQNAGLLPWKTVWQNANLSLRLHGEYPATTAQAVLAELGLAESRDRYPAELSEGMKRRVGIARALSTSPRVMLMDEPLASLDTLTKERIQDLFLRLWKRHRFTLILVTHDIEEAVFLGQRIAVLSDRPASVRRMLDNPNVGALDYRAKPEFQKTVLAVRAALEEK